jgi:KUP system potassium uptake protein
MFPLYAFKQCFLSRHGITPTIDNVLGVLSLILWSLIVVVSIKYLLFILRADNRGEGGIIALVALLNPWRSAPWSRSYVLMLMGLFGAAPLRRWHNHASDLGPERRRGPKGGDAWP